jgi:DNA-binding SARP family transcriptional activator/tetratricopeptide (TPR) repeat protein
VGVGVGVGLRLLGPVHLWTGSTEVPAGPPRQCAVLAALAVDAGRLVPVDLLVDRVWGEDPPERARRTLHAHITRIRRTVEQVAAGAGRPVAVLRRSGGYLLDVDPDQVDLHRFRRLTAQARTLGADDERRLGLLREALGLWRGEPLTGVPGEWAGRMRRSWRQEHLAAVVAWADAELRSGDPGAVIGPVRELAEEQPLVEPLAVVLMQAHAAAGHPADALAVFDGIRRRLADELGADPGPQLRAVHQALLRGELPPLTASGPAPAAAVTVPAAPVPAAPVPAQLPADVPGFTGRATELAWLDRLLASTDTGAGGEAPTAVLVTVVSGTAGVGKTALAVHWAHRVADRFPDGQLYVNLRGFDPGGQLVEPARALRAFLGALGVPAQRIPADLDAATALYRSLLAGRRMLVVLDNAADAEHVRPLLPGAPPAVVAVTSRDQLAGLIADGAHPLPLELLRRSEARELLEQRLDPVRIAADPDALEQMVTACARLPLALTIAAARAAIHPRFPLAPLAAELTQAAGGGSDAGEVINRVRAVFSWSYAALPAPAARLFRLLGLHPGPDISAAAAASLAAVPPAQVSRQLAELTRVGLLTEHAPGRYGFHDLLAGYAADLTSNTDTDEQRHAATVRLLDCYTHTADAAEQLVSPARDPLRLALTGPATGTVAQRFADLPAALSWLTAEQPVLLAVLRLAARSGLHTHAWQLARLLDTFLDRRGHWHDLVEAWQVAVTAADHLGHRAAAADAYRRLALAETQLDDHGQAHAHLLRALDRSAEAGDPVGQAHAHRALGYLWRRQEETDRALGHAEAALTLYRVSGDRRGQANALNAVGWYQALLGDHTRALASCRQALPLLQQLGDRDGEAATWDSLGYIHNQLGQFSEAAGCYQRTLRVYRDLGDRYEEADTLTHLGDTHEAAGNPGQARAAWQQALEILTDLDHPDAATVRAKLTRHSEASASPAGPPGS